jgi:hypothetical protein
MNFDELKNSWQTQPINTDMKIMEFKSTFDSKWQKHQRKVLKMNVCMTLGFLAAMTAIAWVYFSFKDQYDWPFKVGLISSYVLMIIFSFISWKSYGLKKENFEVASTDFIKYQIQKIDWQRRVISQYFWVYMVLLWLALVMYIWEITAPGTALFRYSALGICSAYLAALCIWEVKKQKKQLAFLDGMKAELEGIFS